MSVISNPCIQGVIVYVGFFGLATWRWLGHWDREKNFARFYNYINGFFILIASLFTFECILFTLAVARDFRVANHIASFAGNLSAVNQSGVKLVGTFLKSPLTPIQQPLPESFIHLNATTAARHLIQADHPVEVVSDALHIDLEPAVLHWPVIWVRSLVLASPAVFVLIFALTFLQSRTHLRKIRESRNEVAIWEHDRVLNIILVPVVYGVMVFCALVHVYYITTSELQSAIESGMQNTLDTQSAINAFETLLYIADTYEAWTLYQFGQLTCEILTRHLAPRTDVERSDSRPGELSAASAFQAVSNVMWVGTWLFVLVCCAEAGWALIQWFVAEDPQSFEESMNRFVYAGLVASAAAIYNVHTVESTFGHYIEGYNPFTKFLSVKLLVFFSYWQEYVLEGLRLVHILPFTDVEMKLLQASLLMLECLVGSIMHIWSWDYKEKWYAPEVDSYATEKTPLRAGPWLSTAR
mmetsp:Transcript_8088/g.18934  ORF Transcript_8088/g.18934 Transcript_8088/m.18934 type:complete len:468 (-) Transcript_8088:37-1440(-)